MFLGFIVDVYIEYTERGDNQHVILMHIESLDSQIPSFFTIYFGDSLSWVENVKNQVRGQGKQIMFVKQKCPR